MQISSLEIQKLGILPWGVLCFCIFICSTETWIMIFPSRNYLSLIVFLLSSSMLVSYLSTSEMFPDQSKSEKLSLQSLNSTRGKWSERWQGSLIVKGEQSGTPDMRYNHPVPLHERHSNLPILGGDKPKSKEWQVIRCSCRAAQDF